MQGLGRREELPRAQVTRKALEVMDMFLTLIVEMASQLSTGIKTYVVHSKMCSLLYVSKAIRKKILAEGRLQSHINFLSFYLIEYISFALRITVFNSLKLLFTVSSVCTILSVRVHRGRPDIHSSLSLPQSAV